MRNLFKGILTLICLNSTITTGAFATGLFVVKPSNSHINIMVEPNPDLQKIEMLGDQAGSKKNWDLALKYYRQLVNAKPLVANYHYKYGGALGMVAKNSSKFKALGMIDEIKESFEKAIELDKNHIEARYALIELYLELPGIVGGSERKAQKYAAELMSFSPIDGYLAKGRIAEYFKRYKQAEHYFLQAHKLGNSKTTKQKLIQIYKITNQPNKLNALD
jgi:tetratricopeptide (TPR) repeat protein